ncbi:hypothetical protein BX616_009044, partial [Lobosporangium transversale]
RPNRFDKGSTPSCHRSPGAPPPAPLPPPPNSSSILMGGSTPSDPHDSLREDHCGGARELLVSGPHFDPSISGDFA